jgi:hypothetical protein
MFSAIFRSTCPRITLAIWLFFFAARADLVSGGESAPSWEFDVRAAVSKAGCNLGACHGNLNGKGGFKLSLRAEDPRWDHQALTHDWAGRRINVQEPDRSLILLKATGRVAHQGGVRFDRDSSLYHTLRQWIAGGAAASAGSQPRLVRIEVSPSEQALVAPEDHIQLQVTAVFDNGLRRDVTDLAIYETSNLLAEVSSSGLARRLGWGECTVLVRLLDQQAAVRLAFIPERPDFAWRQLPQALARGGRHNVRAPGVPRCDWHVAHRRRGADFCFRHQARQARAVD